MCLPSLNKVDYYYFIIITCDLFMDHRKFNSINQKLTLITVKALLIARTFIITFHRDRGGHLLEARVLINSK